MLTVNQFLNERMDGILRMERDNKNMVHLFHVNDSWSAVEKSAYFLSQLVACDVITLLAKGNDEAPGGADCAGERVGRSAHCGEEGIFSGLAWG